MGGDGRPRRGPEGVTGKETVETGGKKGTRKGMGGKGGGCRA